jgi:tetratricopeptide (TPR) repeat protein
MEQFFVFLDNYPWVSIGVFALFQLLAFLHTVINLTKYRNFFPTKQEWKAVENGKSYLIEMPDASLDMNKLVVDINEYLEKNEGTIDFGIIKDKAERRLDSLYEDAMSRASFPTYLGLMGTFFGVYIGLKCFNFNIQSTAQAAESGITDAVIAQLIGGIIVSMVTSLVGLVLMMISNWYASICEKEVEQKKNKFYNFLQVELLPVLGTSMVSALDKLHQTIGQFGPSFRGIIDDFKAAFAECTATLRDTFGEKVQVLTDAVDAMGRNMTLINKNVQSQDDLLRTLRQRQTLDTLQRFTEAADKFGTVTSSIERLNDIKDNIATASENLVKAQSEYVEQMAVPERVFEKINGILDRITTFESSINALGKDIAETQLLGNSQMNIIQEQINAIKHKTSLAVSYQETTDEQLENIYQEQAKAINEINAQYRKAIQTHSDDFEAAMTEFKSAYEKIVNECKLAVEAKREEYVEEIRKSLDLEKNDRHLAQLDKIPQIQAAVTSIRDSVENQSAVLAKLDELKKEIGKGRQYPVSQRVTNDDESQHKRKKGLFSKIFGRKK